jgi:hypothetical protein
MEFDERMKSLGIAGLIFVGAFIVIFAIGLITSCNVVPVIIV